MDDCEYIEQLLDEQTELMHKNGVLESAVWFLYYASTEAHQNNFTFAQLLCWYCENFYPSYDPEEWSELEDEVREGLQWLLQHEMLGTVAKNTYCLVK